MKFGLIVVIVLLLSAVGVTFLLQDPGYVVINFRSYLIEMSVPALVALILSLIFCIWLIAKLLRAPRRLGEAAGRYRNNRAGQRLTRGMIEMAEGNFARGERMLVRAANTSETPLLNYLQAARAAHLQGNDERRDDWLRLAYEHTPEAANAVLLTQAELQLDRKQYEQALATLRKIEENTPNQSQAMALLGQLYFRLEDWRALEKLLPRLEKKSRVAETTLIKWSTRVHREHLLQATDGDAVTSSWEKVPRKLRKNSELLAAYAENLMRLGLHEQAEKVLTNALKADWNSALVAVYGKVEAKDSVKQLKKAEAWLRDHPDDATLLLTAARLCLRNELWGKARSYLETTIAILPTPEAYQEYGRLLSRLGEADASADAYRTGLHLVARSPLPAIPHIEADQH